MLLQLHMLMLMLMRYARLLTHVAASSALQKYRGNRGVRRELYSGSSLDFTVRCTLGTYVWECFVSVVSTLCKLFTAIP